MVERAATSRAEAIQEFAASLRDVRTSAGTPSFREMSGRSQAISHTTLHEAAQGLRLPSWATTVEFLKACGADPADHRDAWLRADEAVKVGASTPAGEAVRPAEPLVPVAETPSEPTPPVVTPPASSADPAAPPPGPRRRRRAVALVATGAVAVVTAVVVGVVLADNGDDDSPAAAPPAMTAADCPVQQRNPPPVEPATPGDQAAFISDITLPDCSLVARGETVVKTWRFKNVGTVPWVGYSLHRVDQEQDRDQCQTIGDVALDDTAPGEVVDVSVTVTAPQQAGFCFVRFKFEDAAGRVAFPAARPVNFQIVVE